MSAACPTMCASTFHPAPIPSKNNKPSCSCATSKKHSGVTTRKQTVAEKVGLDNIDNLRYRIKTYFQKFPALFEGASFDSAALPGYIGMI
jgi:hypothetical protein